MVANSLPQEMQQHTYAIMDRVEDKHWWFVGRRAILESFLRAIVIKIPNTLASVDADKRVRAPLRILDVGCGTGANLEMLSQYGQAEGVDVSDDALEFCRGKGLAVQKGLAEKLPYSDETFDITTALDVVEHLDDDIAGLKEMHRVTKTGGYSLIFVPAFMWLWGVQDDISHHRIRYKRREIVDRLEKAGYTIERATYANFTFFLPILGGRTLMRLTGIKPESENNVNISALNGLFGKIFASERFLLKNFDFPLGVSIVIVARKQ
jgi:SAM-dependent methyltransferase